MMLGPHLADDSFLRLVPVAVTTRRHWCQPQYYTRPLGSVCLLSCSMVPGWRLDVDTLGSHRECSLVEYCWS